MKNVIYKIRNVVNEHYYVGSTVDSRKRFWSHRKALRSNTHNCTHLQRAWNKYGEDCFKFEIVEQLESREELFPAEQKWLDAHHGADYCYNISPYADAPMRNASPELRAHLAEKTTAWLEREGHPRQGVKHTVESLARISENRKGKMAGEEHYRYGQSVTEDVRKKIGDTQRGKPKAPGRKVSPEGMAKIRAAAEAGHYSHWEGKSHTEESRMKMGKQVVAVLPDGTTREFITMNAAAQELGVPLPTIIRGCKTGKPVKTGVLAGWVLSYKGKEYEAPHIPDEYKHLPRSRSQARAEGAKEYFTGVPCTHGHIAPRKLKGTCTTCLKTQPKEKKMKTEVVVNGVPHSVVLERFLTTAPKKDNSDWPKRLDLHVEDGEKYVVTNVYYVPEDVERAVDMLISGVQDVDMGRFWQEAYRCFSHPTVQALQSFDQQLKSLASQDV